MRTTIRIHREHAKKIPPILEDIERFCDKVVSNGSEILCQPASGLTVDLLNFLTLNGIQYTLEISSND